MIILEIALALFLIINEITLIYFIWNRKTKKEENSVKRIHPTIKTSNYNNSYGSRTVSLYDKYKNKDGLYEPIKVPHQGIEIKAQKEE